MRVPIDPEREYKPSEIARFGFILDTKGKPNYRYVTNLIQKGKLRARNVGAGAIPYYKVLGKDIIKWKQSTVTIPEQQPYEPGSRGARPFPQSET